MFLLDIKQSTYIFQQQIAISIITLAICVILIGVCAFKMFKAKGSTLEIRKIISRNLFYIIVIMIVYFLVLFPFWKDTIVLRARGVETIGKTIAVKDHGDGDVMILFEFEVNGESFSAEGETVYYGRRLEGIICPGGNYIVIYDPRNPNNCVMDFKRPSKQ